MAELYAWSEVPEFVKLAAFFDEVQENPAAISDDVFVETIHGSLWPTNCWAWAEAAFAVIAPGCILRPHLVRELIAIPIDAIVAAGLDAPEPLVDLGISLATRPDAYLDMFTDEGRRWMLEEWPKHAALAREVFLELRAAALAAVEADDDPG